MKAKHIRAFEIEGTTFHLTDRGDETLQVTSIHPYDETEYHWAVQATKSIWHVYRADKHNVVIGGSEITPEHIARVLLNMDAEAHLKPTPAI